VQPPPFILNPYIFFYFLNKTNCKEQEMLNDNYLSAWYLSNFLLSLPSFFYLTIKKIFFLSFPNQSNYHLVLKIKSLKSYINYIHPALFSNVLSPPPHRAFIFFVIVFFISFFLLSPHFGPHKCDLRGNIKRIVKKNRF